MKSFIAGYVVLLIFLVVALFHPYSFHITNSLPNAIDPVFYAWNLGHDVQSFMRGAKSLLDTNIFYPATNTLALSDTLYAQSVELFPIIALTHNPVFAENLYILSSFVIAALAMFAFAYYVTKNTTASALAGIFFAFCVPRIAQIGHMPALSSQWVPLVFLFLIRFLETASFTNLWLTFLFYFLSITSSIYFGVFLLPLVAVAAVVYISRVRAILKPIAISLVPMLILLTIVLFPYIRFRAENPTIGRAVEDVARLSAKPIHFLTVLPTSWLSDIGFPTSTNEEPLYPTITLLVLAGIGAVVGWKTKRRYTLFFLLSAVFAFVLSLGPYIANLRAPYYYVYRLVPLFEIVRVPARLSIMVIFSLAGLAAIGLAKIKNRMWLLLVLLMYLTEIWQVSTPSVRVPTEHEIPPVYAWLEQQPDTAIVAEVPMRPFDTTEPMDIQLMHTYDETRDNNGYALETYRVYFSYFHRKRILNGYSGFFPQTYHDRARVLQIFNAPDVASVLKKDGVSYLLVHMGQFTQEAPSDFSGFTNVAQFGTDYVYKIL